MNCPRCGEPMSGGVCNNCGFPAAKIGKKNGKDKRIVYIAYGRMILPLRRW